MTQDIYFKIIMTKDLELDMTLDQIRKHPSYAMAFNEFSEKLVQCMYEPAKGFDKESFIKMVTKKLKQKYQAKSVEVIDPIERLNR